MAECAQLTALKLHQLLRLLAGCVAQSKRSSLPSCVLLTSSQGCCFVEAGGGVVAHAFNPSTLKTEAVFWVRGQPGLQSEFQDSQGYTKKPCLKTKQNKTKQKQQKKALWKFSELWCLISVFVVVSWYIYFFIIRMITAIVTFLISSTFTASANFYSMQSLETYRAFIVDTKWYHLTENVLTKIKPNKSFHDSQMCCKHAGRQI